VSLDLIGEVFNLFNRFNEAAANPFYNVVNLFNERSSGGNTTASRRQRLTRGNSNSVSS
jgi:hypothetical protein